MQKTSAQLSTSNALTHMISDDPIINGSFHRIVPQSGLSPISNISPLAVGGPIGGAVILPKRARPGRKPATEPAGSEKKENNRGAARRFRAKEAEKKKQELEAIRRKAEAEKQRLILEAQEAELARQHKRKREDEESTSDRSHSNSLSRSASLLPPSSILVPALDGCGRCVEGGHCPCVDSLIETDDFRDTINIDSLHQLPDYAQHRDITPRLEISRLLNPGSPRSKRQSIASPTKLQPELEIDFTRAFRNAYDPVIGSHSVNRCGACAPDDNGCLCRKASLAAARSSSNDSNQGSSSATSTAPTGPGSCSRCQADPEQRAWCQNLARQQTPLSLVSNENTDNIDPQLTRPQGQTETISCSEAYGVHQRYKENKQWRKLPTPPLSTDEVLQSVKERPREFSAYEVDVGTILSNLKHTAVRRSSTRR